MVYSGALHTVIFLRCTARLALQQGRRKQRRAATPDPLPFPFSADQEFTLIVVQDPSAADV